jgi:hypothetical protein
MPEIRKKPHNPFKKEPLKSEIFFNFKKFLKKLKEADIKIKN